MGTRVNGAIRRSARRSTKPSSSEETAQSKTGAGVLELGSELVKALGQSTEHDLLANWMAHHLAGKLALEKAARGLAKKQLSDECADLILRLWAHRHSLPDGVRPLGGFEPIFKILEELASDQPRNSLLRARPRAKASNAAEEFISAALTIDSAATSLIRYTLARAADRIPAKDKRWSKLRAALAPAFWNMKIVIKLIDEVESLVDEKQKLKHAAIEELQRMLKNLEAFDGMARVLREQLEKQLSSHRSAT